MQSDSNKQLVRKLFDDYLSTGQLARLDEVIAASYDGGKERGPAAFATPLGRLRAAFPDLVYTLHQIIVEGDRVAVRWTWQGTFTKTYVGLVGTFEPNGKKVHNTGFAMFEIAGGKLIRGSLETDRLGFLVAIGAIPDQPGFAAPAPPVR